ncbi:ThuA domain-containing protein [Dyadobacter psychrotolerans]|uniref:ThuA domain-containing protein n=1 Tax=Dyadobacter psychrotolerans TaxID=2541721 RepID=A0A4R5DZM5_9BACT|nr:ThuA domain-containing protein [Dyadobacter psychrotolerans]TDE17651.1 ThuA domain-containing protein [Dyadobacter psychrotolerans]
MNLLLPRSIISLLIFLMCSAPFQLYAQTAKFRVIAFYTAKNDRAHVSFVHEANRWFPKMAEKYQFSYDSTNNWNNLNTKYLSDYQVVIFLDTRPETPEQRLAFENYVKNGGGWMGFHFSAFALSPSAYPQNWDWYHNTFLGSGQYKSNTWRPTSAILRIENQNHPITNNLPETFRSSPNEWYCWEKDLKANPDIEVLASVDSTSFPLGTGPKAYEIWNSGYYPIVWRNKNYRMVYFNMGHNDIDYENKTNKELSFTFENEVQNRLILNGLLWIGNAGKKVKK